MRREALEVWEQVVWKPEAFIALGERIVVPVCGRNRGRNGIELEWSAAAVYTLRDGKIARSELYQSKEEALEAAGVPERDSANGS